MQTPRRLELDDARWAEFVNSQAHATPFHHPAWASLLADCYGLTAFAFVLEEAADVVAGVPVVELRRPAGRKRWVALPFTDMLAPLGRSEPVSTLLAELDAARVEEGIRSLEVRAEVAGGTGVRRGLSHALALDPDPEAVFATFSRSQVQRNVARAEREGVQVRVADRPDDLMGSFYRLHLMTRRRQGVPIQPRRFFRLLWERTLRVGLGRLLVAELDGRAIAAAVFLEWNGRSVYKFGASDSAAWSARPNHALFWEAIRQACTLGLRELDFGRTDIGNEGLRAFKSGWGTRERDLVYTAFGSVPESSANGRLGRALAATIRRSPPWVCQLLGERLYRYAG